MSADTDNDRELDYRREIAETIQNQIPRWLRLAVGYRFPSTTEKGLRFQVRGRSTYIVEVDFDRGSDAYDVRVSTKGARARTFYSVEQVYADDMVEIIDRIDRGKLSPETER